jgi:hypothetical protein
MEFYQRMSQLLGLGIEPKELSFSQVALRALIVFFATLVIVRLAEGISE